MNFTTIIISYVMAIGVGTGSYSRALVDIIYELLINTPEKYHPSVDRHELDERHTLIMNSYEHRQELNDAFIKKYLPEIKFVDHNKIKSFAHALHEHGKVGTAQWIFQTFGDSFGTYIITTNLTNEGELCNYYKSSLESAES